MSVQQQIDRINTAVSAQETLLDQALAAIANKAAGGGASVKTCTVTVGGTLDPVTATVLDNGVIKSIATTSYTIENVVCGGTVVVFSQPAGLTFSATGAKMIASQGGYSEYHVFAIDPDATTVTISAESDEPV